LLAIKHSTQDICNRDTREKTCSYEENVCKTTSLCAHAREYHVMCYTARARPNCVYSHPRNNSRYNNMACEVNTPRIHAISAQLLLRCTIYNYWKEQQI